MTSREVHAGDFGIFKSASNTDDPNSGGPRTNEKVTRATDVFSAIDDKQAAMGGFSLRLLYAAMPTPDSRKLNGPYAFISSLPKDERVSPIAFVGRRYGETRRAATDVIESYREEREPRGFRLLSPIVKGTRSISLYMGPQEPPPKVGECYLLEIGTEPRNGVPQYSKALGQYFVFDAIEADYIDPYFMRDGDRYIQARVMSLRTLNPATIEVKNVVPMPFEFKGQLSHRWRATGASSKLNICSATRLKAPIQSGQSGAVVESVQARLVPATSGAATIADVSIDNAVCLEAAAGAKEEKAMFISARIEPGADVPTGVAIFPGSLEVSATIGSAAIVYADSGDGNLRDPGTKAIVGAINYKSGSLAFNDNATRSYAPATISFTPAAAPVSAPETRIVKLGLNAASFVEKIFPPPAPGSLRVDYTINGQWYRLADTGRNNEAGQGVIAGVDERFGGGVLNRKTGSVQINLATSADEKSSALFTFSNPNTRKTYKEMNGAPSKLEAVLPFAPALGDQDQALVRGSLRGSWRTAQGTTANFTSDRASGDLKLTSGEKVGRVNWTTRTIFFDVGPNLPASGTQIFVTYSFGGKSAEYKHAKRATSEPNKIILKVGENSAGEAVVPGSFTVEWDTHVVNYDPDIRDIPPSLARDLRRFGGSMLLRRWYFDPTIYATDDGKGNLFDQEGRSCGGINYATGEFWIKPDGTLKMMAPVYDRRLIKQIEVSDKSSGRTDQVERVGWTCTGMAEYDALYRYDEDTDRIRVAYANAESEKSQTLTLNRLTFNSNIGVFGELVEKSLTFKLGDWLYYDAGGGAIRRMPAQSRLTGGGYEIPSGTIEYSSGKVELYNWGSSEFSDVAAAEPKVLSALYSVIPTSVTTVVFRTFAAPIVSGQFLLSFTRAAMDGDGEKAVYRILTETARADSEGVIIGDHCVGTIQYGTGIVQVRFGRWVTIDDAVRASDWFKDAANPPELSDDKTKAWKPIPVLADSITYTAAVNKSLAQDPTGLGIDPIKLPLDGQIQVLDKGKACVLNRLEERKCSAKAALETGAFCGLADCDSMAAVDADGKEIGSELALFDLARGNFFLRPEAASAFSSGALKEPIYISGSQREIKRITGADIAGEITFSSVTRRAYEAGKTLVSGLLNLGEYLGANVTNCFSLKTWTDQRFVDACPAGQEIAAALQKENIELTNEGAEPAKWCILFTRGAREVMIYGEGLGAVGQTFSVDQDIAPINPKNQKPFFTIKAGKLGGGWNEGNAIRFDTEGCAKPIWVGRVVMPSNTTKSLGDKFDLALAGNYPLDNSRPDAEEAAPATGPRPGA